MVKSLPSNTPGAPGPVFPRFKPLTLADREIFRPILWDYQAETSELTFTNLFIWQSHYGYQWSLDRDRLLVVSASGRRSGLGPAAGGPRAPGRSVPAGFGLAPGRVRGGGPRH